ncbi:nicolin-1-like isoform X2 [Mercenaria mercenaria]|uniref:nicolin-1-like isoform X2 n=1 Tax=Mercenaria mercenaria TaxID=6596 RepID=UPI00234F2770|nr:nicolin-1-like isoform X2 [Mercenaria mercenaria]
MTERPLHCTIKNPVTLNISDLKSEFHSGCRIIDVSLSNIINPEKTQLSLKSAKGKSKVAEEVEQVGEIHFKNSYTAYLTVKAKCRIQDSKDGNEMRWRTCVKKMKLMSSPHVEAGAQDYFVITRKHMQFELVNVSALRIILQQPSSVWKEFKIEDLKIYRSSESGRPNPLPAWLTDTPNKSGKKKVEDAFGMGVTNLEALSSTLQQLWALSEEVAAQQTNRALGRYEVDGCYEINLLSYP